MNGKGTAALSKCHNTKDKTNLLYCCGGWGNFHETRSVIKLFVYTAKSTEIRKWEPVLKPHENRDDKTELQSLISQISSRISFCLEEVWNVRVLAACYLEGVMGVRSLPRVCMTRRPQIQSPVQIPTPPYRSNQIGVEAVGATEALS